MENLKKYKVKLASKSPRRRELLAMLDVDFEIPKMVEVDEVIPDGLDPLEVPLYLASLKAAAYRSKIADNELYITADTIVLLDGEILGKPRDEAEACEMLKALSGQTHEVVTGVCVFTRDRMERFSSVTRVSFDRLTDDEISYYVSRYSPLDKAGAYGIQEWIGGAAIIGVDGSFYNVMGLPLQRLYCVLKTF